MPGGSLAVPTQTGPLSSPHGAALWWGRGVGALGAVPGAGRERRTGFRAGMNMENFWPCSAADSDSSRSFPS